MRTMSAALGFFFLLSLTATAQIFSSLSPYVREYVKVDAAVVAITHARVIDGTGTPARDNQTIVVRDGKIQAVGDASTVTIPPNATVIDGVGRSLIPGIIDMHGHMFYTAGNVYKKDGTLAMGGITLNELFYTYPRLYLAAGITSVRTTGAIEPYTDLNLKKWIDRGMVPGPKMDVTSPYMEGEGTMFPQMHEITSPADARKTAAYWADEGVTSFKAYMNITREELKAVIEEAHRRGLKVTGHLCSVTSREAAELGIDNLEHGPIAVDTEFVPGKSPDICPPFGDMLDAQAHVDVNSPLVQRITDELVRRHVAVTSTLSVYELDVPSHLPLRKDVTEAMLPESLASYLAARARMKDDPRWLLRLRKEMQWEHDFAKAGGKLLAGSDPTGVGAVLGGDLAGYGMQRELELLVEAGFTPLEAIHIATQQNAEFLGKGDQVGSIAPGKQADIVLIQGDPSTNIADVEKVETVFKDGVGYDPAKLAESVRGMVGLR